MPAFRFEAIDAAGKAQKGVLDADSARGARTNLRSQGLTPLVVEPAATRTRGERNQRLSLGRRLSQREQAILTRQLASLLIAGLPLDEALSVLTEQSERDYIRELMASIRAEVLGGHSLANALTQHPKDFPEIYRALVAAGEHTGKLGLVLSRLADYIEQRNALKQKIVLAFTYPAIVTMIAFGIVTFLLSYVVPQVVNVFASTKQQLPILTIMMMALSGFVRQLVVGDADRGGGAGVSGALDSAAARPTSRLRPVAVDRPAARQARARLQHGALCQHARHSDGSRRADSARAAGRRRNAQQQGDAREHRRCDRARARRHVVVARARQYEDVSAGAGAPDPFGRSDRRRDDDARSRGRRRSRELERRTMFLTSLLEPLLILAMGGVVLVIVLAVMLPIIELNNLVQ